MARVISLLTMLLCCFPASAQESLLRLQATESADSLRPLPPDWLDWSDNSEPRTTGQIAPVRLPSTSPSYVSSAPLPFAYPTDSSPITSEVRSAYGSNLDQDEFPLQRIATYIDPHNHPSRMVRYDVPLTDLASHETLRSRGIEGTLMEVPLQVELRQQSTTDRMRAKFLSLFGLLNEDDYPKTAKVVRYEVPADDILLHTALVDLDGEIYEPSMLRLPEVRFFQPKARVFMDMKRENDDEFDLFSNGAVLASLDVVELYFPMPLISDRFARAVGKPSRLSALGWRVGATVGVGITTALTNGENTAGRAPITTFSSGIRYDFPLGRPSREVIETGDLRLDQRTRVGIETGVQGGISSDESLGDSTDWGWYFGILVNTPWGHYGG